MHTPKLRALFVCALIASTAIVLAARERPAAAKKDAKKEDLEKARDLFEAGKKSYNLGDFDKAIELWKEGYALKDDPIFLFNVAQAFRQKSDLPKAVFFYKTYLREAPDAKNRPDVEARIAELQKVIDAGRTQTDAPPSGIGDMGHTTTPETTTPETTTPETTVPTESEPTPEAEPEPEPDVKPQPEAEPPPEEEASHGDTGAPRPGRGLKIAGIVTGGAGVALVITGIIFASKASSLQGELEDAVAMGTPWSSDLDSKRSDGKSAATMSQLTIGIGAAAIVGGGVLFFLGMKKDSAAAEHAWQIMPEVSPAGAGVVVRIDY